MTLVKNSAKVFSTRILRLIISLATGIILARWLQPEGRGAFSLITQLIQFAVAIGGMSIGYATIHFSGSGKYTTEEQVANSSFSAIVFSSLVCIIIIVAQPLMNRLFPFNYHDMIIILLIIPVAMFDSYLRAVLQSKYQFTSINRLEVFQVILFAIAIVTCAYTFRPFAYNAVIAWGISLLISFIVLTRIVSRMAPIHLRFERTLFKEHLSFGAKAHLTTVVGLLSLRFDQYILGALTNTSEVGKYAVAVSLAELLWVIPSSVSFVLLPMASHDNIMDSIRQIKRACLSVLGISIVTAVALALIAKPLIVYGFGESYRDSIRALMILLPGMVAVSITTVTTPFFLGKLGKPYLGAIVAAVSLVTNIVLNFILIPTYGLVGACVSSTISYILATLVNIAIFNNVCKKQKIKVGILL